MSFEKIGPQHCSECDYALEGLPSTGTCPECGCPYDERFVIVRGYATGSGANYMNSSPAMIPILFLTGSAGLFFQLLPRMLLSGWRHVSSDHVAILVIVLFGIVMLMRRWDLSGPPCQLWMCAEGFWFRDRVALIRRPRAEAIGGWFALICLVALCGFVSYLSPITGSFLIVVVALLLWKIRSNRPDEVARHQAVETPSTGEVPFLRWQQAVYINVMARSKGRHLITIKPVPASFWRFETVTTVSLLAEISPEPAAKIHLVASRWIDEQRSVDLAGR